MYPFHSFITKLREVGPSLSVSEKLILVWLTGMSYLEILLLFKGAFMAPLFVLVNIAFMWLFVLKPAIKRMERQKAKDSSEE